MADQPKHRGRRNSSQTGDDPQEQRGGVCVVTARRDSRLHTFFICRRPTIGRKCGRRRLIRRSFLCSTTAMLSACQAMAGSSTPASSLHPGWRGEAPATLEGSLRRIAPVFTTSKAVPGTFLS